MKKWKKILLWLFIIGLIAAGVVAYVVFKKPPTAADSKPVKEFTSVQLIAEFQKDKKLADSVYMYKNLGVSGKIRDTANKTIFLEAGEGAAIQCTFDSSYFVKNAAKFTKGATVKIKGIYYANDGLDEKDAAGGDDMDLLSDMKEKKVLLRTCAINE